MIKIEKRNKEIVEFNKEKIENAVIKAFLSKEFTINGEEIYKEESRSFAKGIANEVLIMLKKIYDKGSVVSVERIQNLIEDSLMKAGFTDVAKSFITYRYERTLARNKKIIDKQKRFVKTIQDITFAESEEENFKRENANVDGNTSMGTMLQYGSSVSKDFALNHILKDEYVKAHKEGDIHIHDLDFLSIATTTCTQINLEELFSGGFSTGHGFIREPQSIASYAALTAIAIQANQNDQHGGQSINAFDYYLAPGVIKSFRKSLKEQVEVLVDFYLEEDFDFKDIFEGIDNLESISLEGEEIKRLTSRLAKELEDKAAKKIVSKAYNRALKIVEKQTYQAMESLVHNLNTMNSRAGEL